MRRRSKGRWEILVTLTLILLATATVIDKVLNVYYSYRLGPRLVVLAATLALAFGLTAFVLSLLVPHSKRVG
ncbi:MAG: hypothetical protein QXM08_00440 [Thermofilaceae archaeon]